MFAAVSPPGSALPGPVDLTVPPVSAGEPAPGHRVRVVLPAYAGTEVFHLVYLPTDYGAGQRYPVICEYPGNGPYTSPWGDFSTGLVEGCCLGYGLSGGQGCIWVSLPLISTDHRQHQRLWWGDVAATVDYCLTAVEATCRTFGGRREALVLAGSCAATLNAPRCATGWRPC